MVLGPDERVRRRGPLPTALAPHLAVGDPPGARPPGGATRRVCAQDHDPDRILSLFQPRLRAGRAARRTPPGAERVRRIPTEAPPALGEVIAGPRQPGRFAGWVRRRTGRPTLSPAPIRPPAQGRAAGIARAPCPGAPRGLLAPLGGRVSAPALSGGTATDRPAEATQLHTRLLKCTLEVETSRAYRAHALGDPGRARLPAGRSRSTGSVALRSLGRIEVLMANLRA